MKTYLIKWDSGYGESWDEIEAESFEDALNTAYESWREEAESNAVYSAEEMTDELREEYL